MAKPRSSNHAELSLFFLLALFLSVAVRPALAQENTSGDSTTPLVYNLENTGVNYPQPVFPVFSQLPIIRPLPDPFRFVDGSRETSFSSWERRRNEIKAAIETYEIGPKPDCSDCTINAAYAPNASGGGGVMTVVVTRNSHSLTLTSHITLPSGSGPFPALIPMALAPAGNNPDTGALPASVFANVATVEFVHNQVTEYSAGQKVAHNGDPFYQLYPELCAGTCPAGSSNSGQYAAWSWGVSRLIDGLEIISGGVNAGGGTAAGGTTVNPVPIDLSHLAVTGCSYAGKMALFAGAFDERVALTIAQENGGGGAASWRVSHEIEANGAVEDIDDTDYDWFGSQMRQFGNDNVYKMPTDHHELMAMVAPRALLETGNTDFYWLSNGSNYISARATQKIYNTFGIGDRFGFYIDGGHSHCATLPAETPVIQAFVDKFLFGQATVSTDVEVRPSGPPAVNPPAYSFPTMNYQRWTQWWGTNTPVFPDNWNTGGTMIVSMNPGLDIDSGDTIDAAYAFAMPGSHPEATVSLAGANVQTDVSCPDGSSYTLTIPFPAGQSYLISSGDNAWVPSGNGTSPVVYQSSATATTPAGSPVCNGGVANHAYFSALGATSGAGNPGGAGVLSTDTTDPLNVRFQCSDNGAAGRWSPKATVNFQVK